MADYLDAAAAEHWLRVLEERSGAINAALEAEIRRLTQNGASADAIAAAVRGAIQEVDAAAGDALAGIAIAADAPAVRQ